MASFFAAFRCFSASSTVAIRLSTSLYLDMRFRLHNHITQFPDTPGPTGKAQNDISVRIYRRVSIGGTHGKACIIHALDIWDIVTDITPLFFVDSSGDILQREKFILYRVISDKSK